jgi:uncharacterized protein (TIGR02271 family)
VSETVQLRQEHVQVERRPVDRPATAVDLTDLKDRTIEVRETAEQAVVAKTARVVEEVRVGKTVEQRTEQITDTLRRERVEVDEHHERARAGSAGRLEQGRVAAPPATGPTPRPTSRQAEPEPRQPSGAGEGWEQLREQVRADAKR